MTEIATSQDVRKLVVDAVAAAAEILATEETAQRWDEPSVLDAMTVGALSAHLVRAAGATLAYLDRTDPATRPDDELLTPVTYFHAAIASPIHDQIREVSDREATIGHQAMVAKCDTLVGELRDRLGDEPADRLVGALGGRMLTLDDFCRTRLIEVLTHIDDLAASVEVPVPELDPRGLSIVFDILTGIARHLHGDWAVLRALVRGERVDPNAPVFPVF